ncbi:expressed unknown protein [Seminavis robusta]|uniref:Uncharacterized protein n=1 Tax=Seminavis robusta TaxID=568900 RepID=A0A9N8H5W7_9STRA|nr:expressed unknown protein [Seminavis robusta]|eukprot:Sro32_g020870.1 n/a (140) ;mRNA; r:96155-96574
MSKELAREILQYVKLRDRPSRLELRIWGGTPMNRIMNITAPVEQGQLVYRLGHYQERRTHWGQSYANEVQCELKFSPEHLQGVIALIDGANYGVDDGRIQVVSVEQSIVLAQFRLPVGDDQRDTRLDIIKGALTTLMGE